jgi:hypothetical protein
LPLGVTLMEAQPASVLLLLGTRLLLDGSSPFPWLLFPQSDWLAFLGGLTLLWWMRSLEAWAEQRPGCSRWRAPARLLPLVLALGLVWGPLLPRVLAGQNMVDLSLSTGFLIWLWRRALTRARLGFEHEALERSFRLGFIAVLASLLLALPASWPDLLAALSLTLPLFFFAGLLTLSLARLATIRRQRLRRAGGTGAVADPTRPWLLALTLLSLLILLLVALLETLFSFATFQTAMALLAPVLGRIWDWVSEALLWLIVLILTPLFDLFALLVSAFHRGGSGSAPVLISPATLRRQLQNPSGQGHLSVPPILLVGGRLLVLFLIVGGLLWLVLRVLRLGRWQPSLPGVEEEREMLNPLTILGERRRQRQRQSQERTVVVSPPLTSLRQLYWAWLQELAACDPAWARQPAETALEYLARLRRDLLTSRETDPADKTETTVPELVGFAAQLTQAYLDERYGNHPVSADRIAALRQRWIQERACWRTACSRLSPQKGSR